MMVGIVADLHANLEATRAVFRGLDNVRPDAVVCLGDVAGYNANPNEVIDLIRERGIPCLMGNHDAATAGLEEPWFFNAKARQAIEWQAEHLRDDNRGWLRNLPGCVRIEEAWLCVHGSPCDRDDYIMDWLDAMRQTECLRASGAHLCFFGHSHRASLFAESGGAPIVNGASRHTVDPHHRCFINPGSVGQPRDQDPRAAFGLFDTDRLVFEFRRAEYDIDAAAQKILNAGLPWELAARLSLGR